MYWTQPGTLSCSTMMPPVKGLQTRNFLLRMGSLLHGLYVGASFYTFQLKTWVSWVMMGSALYSMLMMVSLWPSPTWPCPRWSALPSYWKWTSSARRAISTFGFRSFVACTELLEDGVFWNVLSCETDEATCVVQLEIGGPSAELRRLVKLLYFERFWSVSWTSWLEKWEVSLSRGLEYSFSFPFSLDLVLARTTCIFSHGRLSSALWSLCLQVMLCLEVCGLNFIIFLVAGLFILVYYYIQSVQGSLGGGKFYKHQGWHAPQGCLLLLLPAPLLPFLPGWKISISWTLPPSSLPSFPAPHPL